MVTGGEPMLQLDEALIDALHARGFRVAVETNGTLPAIAGIDWICVSPKAGTEVVQRSGDELKLVWPQEGIDPAEIEGWDFDHFLVQPMDCEERAAAVEAAIRLAMERPKWRLTLQAHKLVGPALSYSRCCVVAVGRRLGRRASRRVAGVAGPSGEALRRVWRHCPATLSALSM